MLGEKLEANTLLAIATDGSVAAEALMFFPPGEDERLALFDGHVHVYHRGRGLGSYLLSWLEARAREEFSAAHGGGDAPLMRTSCAAHQADRIALFEMHGFNVARYSYTMQRDLQRPIPAYPLPTGVQLRPWSPALDQQVMDAFNLAFAGHWGLPQMTPVLWGQLFTRVPQFRPHLSCAALAGDEVVAFSVNWSPQPSQGWLEALGVIPAWRGRGLAKALLAHSLSLFHQAGLEQAALDVDAENPSGALRLYQKLGFAAVKEEIHFIKKLV
jgi:ribosomal protein S18 acetylase RimI-like enzyme